MEARALNLWADLPVMVGRALTLIHNQRKATLDSMYTLGLNDLSMHTNSPEFITPCDTSVQCASSDSQISQLWIDIWLSSINKCQSHT